MSENINEQRFEEIAGDMPGMVELTDEALDEIAGGRDFRASANMKAKVLNSWRAGIASGRVCVGYHGHQCRVENYKGKRYENGDGYFTQLLIILPDGTKKWVLADECIMHT